MVAVKFMHRGFVTVERDVIKFETDCTKRGGANLIILDKKRLL